MILLFGPLVHRQSLRTQHQSLLADLLSEDHEGRPENPNHRAARRSHSLTLEEGRAGVFSEDLVSPKAKAYSCSPGRDQTVFSECFTRQKLNELMQKQLLSSLIEKDTGSGSVVIFVE